MCCVNQLVIETNCKHFINVDILVLVNEFVVVTIYLSGGCFSGWWLVPTTADHCGHIPVQLEPNLMLKKAIDLALKKLLT